MAADPNIVSGKNLEAIQPVLACALAADHYDKQLEPHFIKGWRPRLRVNIGSWDGSPSEREKKLAIVQHFGTVKPYKDDHKYYADLTDVKLDALWPEIRSFERNDALRALDHMIASMEHAKKILTREIPLSDPVLSNALETYRAEAGHFDKIFSLERKLKACGSAMQSLDMFTALQVEAWTHAGSSRNAMLYQMTSLDMFESHLQGLRILRDTLNGQNTGTATDILNPNMVTYFSSQASGPVDSLMERAPATWVTEQEKATAIDNMERATDSVQINHSAFLKAMQQHMLDRACVALQRRP